MLITAPRAAGQPTVAQNHSHRTAYGGPSPAIHHVGYGPRPGYPQSAAPVGTMVSIISPPRKASSAIGEPATMFSPLERTVIQLASGDPLHTVRPATRLGKLSALIFGAGQVRRLADPRLETLRCTVILLRLAQIEACADALQDFLDAGFSAEQLFVLCRMNVVAGTIERLSRIMRLAR